MSAETVKATVVYLLAACFSVCAAGNSGNSYVLPNNYFYAPNQGNAIQDPYLRTLDNFLSMISFESQDQCIEIMCAPLPSKDSYRTPVVFRKVENSNDVPRYFPGQSQQNLYPFGQFDELQRALGENSKFVRDERGNILGVAASNPYYQAKDQGQSGYYSNNDSQPRPVQPVFPANSDVCCTTEEAYFINSTLTDIFGVRRVIAQDWQRGSLQFIRHGFCGTRGVCPGECIQIFVNTPLIISPPDPG
ncbi:unnamed protein product, partial [Lymnaea stagnalis]